MPVVAAKARFVVAVLGACCGEKRWTIIEGDLFKSRIERGEVIPIWSTEVPPSAFDQTRDIGALRFDPTGDLETQARECAGPIAMKVANDNQLKFRNGAT